MKFSVRQILASSAGAVIAALIASSFGVTGTIVGVAIGAAVATTATALVSQSLERGHEAVRQVVQTPESSPLLRRLGATGSAGKASSALESGSEPTEVVPAAGRPTAAAAETAEMHSGVEALSETQRLEISAAAGGPATERLRATTSVPPATRRPSGRARPLVTSRMSWKAMAGTAAVVFVLALGFITAIELISGRTLSSIFGGGGSGTTVKNIFSPSPPPTTTTTTTPPTTSTTTTTSTTPTTSTTATTTSSTTVAGTSTTQPGASTTTTSVAGS
ncbi:MAG TPA: hypothetical protein VEH82_09105, partial [Acidimicrobiales bacterium]|nr:hypothetical protein [Acidimicrobiales bacterium]